MSGELNIKYIFPSQCFFLAAFVKSNSKKLLFIFQGVAWQDVYDGTYYPAVSLYKNSTVWEKNLICLPTEH